MDMAISSDLPELMKLQQDVKELRNSFLVLLQSHQDGYQNCLSDIMAAVQGAQLSGEALRACQSEAAHLQQCLQELDSRFRLEQQRRRALHNSLVELKGNIRVHCRIRPFLSYDKELDGSASQNCTTPGEVAHAVDDVCMLGLHAILSAEAVTSAVEFVGLIHRGIQLRVQHPTLVHKNSSRSHLIVTATLTTASSLGSTAPQSSQGSLQKKAGAGNWWITSPQASSPHTIPVDSADHSGQVLARLQLVDLAGSECAAVSGVTGLALKETSFINRSLAALADVLRALSEHCDHIPYRNSKLTHLLQDSIGGDAKLLMILCVSPGQKHMAETLRALKFGAQARQIERRPSRRRPPSSQMQKSGMGLAGSSALP
ncbi:kinesin-like protein KIF25 [Onychomys torridus]|uniref:kinesin-like protein KIF25 n=1 Tax=Onychomys torridus TaxID=38674 RepID=UPI00167FA620|nr:kinesin-like protein KIF25 [Onychomys torridus]